MAIRVAHVGTGNVGGLALAQLITDPQFELTGVCVSTPEKVGRDAGALCGVALDADTVTGITAVNDLDALLATKPECVVYCAMGDTRLPDAMADVMRILAAGVNVVGSSPGLLQYPWGVMPDKYIARVEDAAQQGKASIFISGVDPGFANDLIPFALASTCQRIESVRCMEIHDYASYSGAEVMHYMGFARPLDEIPMLLQPGVLSIAWGTAIRQLAAGH
jgi:2,4-diaminopentanoate dehydrogenase